MATDIEELDFRITRLGALSLRRRRDPVLRTEVIEIKLNDEFLMSSAFTAAETALAELGLARLEGTELDVLVGGLGLGCTAQAALNDQRVRSVTVIEALAEVIGWHRRGLLPLGTALADNPRCRLVEGDFFAVVGSETPAADPELKRAYHAILLDIDHSPEHLLHPDHGAFYGVDALRRMARRLHPGGVFGMWCDEAPERRFEAVLASAFPATETCVVRFPNPYQKREATATIYLGKMV